MIQFLLDLFRWDRCDRCDRRLTSRTTCDPQPADDDWDWFSGHHGLCCDCWERYIA